MQHGNIRAADLLVADARNEGVARQIEGELRDELDCERNEQGEREPVGEDAIGWLVVGRVVHETAKVQR